jgi:glycosyltransferase involved in cell wall biosynthesis
MTGMNRLWIDLTTAYQDIGRTAHGTLRVERGIVLAMADLRDERIGFVIYDPAGRRFVELPRDVAASIARAPTRPEMVRDVVAFWRRGLAALKHRALRLFRRPATRRRPAIRGGDPFGAGDLLLMLGEHHRHDFSHLVHLKRARPVALAFVFYDLLEVLEDDDPRLSNDDPGGLPPTDFVVNEARLLLPISQYSAGILREHVKRRSNFPAIAPIRLAGHLPDGADRIIPMAGLIPGGFVLSVGDVVDRKNHRLLVGVWAILVRQEFPVPTLVIVGRIDREGLELVRSVRRDRVLRTKILFLPNVNDGVLQWLFAHCRYTAFPSLLEGFGLPVAESLSHGKVCLASSSSAIPEAGQHAAISLDPNDADAWEVEVRRLNVAAELASEEARVRQLFRPVDWADTASDILDAVRQHGLWPVGLTPPS